MIFVFLINFNVWMFLFREIRAAVVFVTVVRAAVVFVTGGRGKWRTRGPGSLVDLARPRAARSSQSEALPATGDARGQAAP